MLANMQYGASFQTAHNSVIKRTQAVREARPRGRVLRIQCTAKKVLVVGGTGRVGSSTAAALVASDADVEVFLAGRSRENADVAKASWQGLKNAPFVECDIMKPEALAKALDGMDLVVHCGGPFQRRTRCEVLEAAIEAKVDYIDVCDDTDFSKMAKGLHDKAKEAGISAITTTGIYPGVSNLMAAEMLKTATEPKSEGADDEMVMPKPLKLEYSYFTAGSGGAGPTILTTSMLLCGEDVVVYKDGKEVTLPPVSYRNVVDFGPGVGTREVFLYNLPEVASAHKIMGIPSVSARFGTSPGVFNSAMAMMAQLAPKSLLQNESSVKPLVALAAPFVKLADPLVGEVCAMKISLQMDNGQNPTGIYVHKKLSVCVGQATAAFAQNVLEGGTKPGVWYPEEEEAVADKKLLLERASKGAKKFEINKPGWMMESTPMNIGFGFYWEK
mmetsp:Transcript_29014/g.55656  ORF Transcript_29014/g.55656 Transcript_29014/m.55656 type:complete len:443 (-) Transcript_29014:230-1558(-)